MMGDYHVRFCERLRVKFPRSTRQRFWRSIKQEYIYLHLPDNGSKLYQGIKFYINYYNERRHHQGIQNDFPAKRYQRSFETNYAA